MRIGVVVQRYGPEVNGGAELLCRTQAEHLVRRPEVDALTVFTTCARDHQTWANHYAPGSTDVAGVRVERFPVWTERLERMQSRLGSYMDAWRLGPIYPGVVLEPAWFIAQGPLAPGLLRRLREVRNDYDVFLFYTYLYLTTAFGLPLVARKAVMIPTAHDEPPIRMAWFRALLRMPQAFGFLTPEERDFVIDTFHIRQPHDVIGTGIGTIDDTNVVPMPNDVTGPYVLYIGRVEPSKGFPQLLNDFDLFKKQHGDTVFRSADGAQFRGADLKLVLAGRVAWIDVPKRSDIVALGFVSDEQRAALLAHTLLFVLPSQYESLSLVILEAWAQHKAVLVNGRCAATAGQVRRSGGGETYDSPQSFSDALARMLSDPGALARKATSGAAYTTDNYAWPRVEDRLLNLAREAMQRG